MQEIQEIQETRQPKLAPRGLGLKEDRTLEEISKREYTAERIPYGVRSAFLFPAISELSLPRFQPAVRACALCFVDSPIFLAPRKVLTF